MTVMEQSCELMSCETGH